MASYIDETKLAALKKAGRVAAETHTLLASMVRPGVNLLQLEDAAASYIASHGCQPAFKGYKGYPAVTCLSVNDEAVHGLPRDQRLENGDIISIDLGVSADGWLVDTARTHAVGKITPVLQRLLTTTAEALEEAVKHARADQTTGDIGSAVEKVVKAAGFSVIRELTGHGVGRTLQEAPSVPNHGQPGRGSQLQPGMVIAIEPITCLKATSAAILADGWTIITRNGLPSAHFEDTVLITDDAPVVLTKQ